MKELIKEYSNRIKLLDSEIESLTEEITEIANKMHYTDMCIPLVEKRFIANTNRSLLIEVVKDLEGYC